MMEIEASGSLTSGEVSDRLHLDPSTVSRTVAKLIEKGFLVTGGGDDRRSKPLMMTPSGRDELDKLHSYASGQVVEALGLLSQRDQSAVMEGLQVYSRALARARAQREYEIGPIKLEDDPAMARIIRTVLASFEMTGPGSAIRDPEVDVMTSAYADSGSAYYVIRRAGKVVGGAGFGPLSEEDGTIAELRKMYLLPEARGCGMGRRLLSHVLDQARAAGYRRMYLETIRRMTAARQLYESFGFEELEGPLGCTGHNDCEVWYAMDL
jgi:putative acetyltransferase